MAVAEEEAAAVAEEEAAAVAVTDEEAVGRGFRVLGPRGRRFRFP